MHVGPERWEKQRVCGDRFDFQVLSVEGGFAAIRDGVEVDDDGQLALPAVRPEGIEVPFEVALVLFIVLDLIARAL